MLVLRSLLMLGLSVCALAPAAGPRLVVGFKALDPTTKYDTDWVELSDPMRFENAQIKFTGKDCEIEVDDFAYKTEMSGVVFKLIEKDKTGVFVVDDDVTAFRVQFRVKRSAEECKLFIDDIEVRAEKPPEKVAEKPKPLVPAPKRSENWNNGKGYELAGNLELFGLTFSIVAIVWARQNEPEYVPLVQKNSVLTNRLERLTAAARQSGAAAAKEWPNVLIAHAEVVRAHQGLTPAQKTNVQKSWDAYLATFQHFENYMKATQP